MSMVKGYITPLCCSVISSCNLFFLKGNVGAAGTVKEWTDFRTKVKYKGFPYSVWKQGMLQPEVLTTPEVKV